MGLLNYKSDRLPSSKGYQLREILQSKNLFRQAVQNLMYEGRLSLNFIYQTTVINLEI